MFTVDCNITDLKIREKSLVKVFFSMNVHQVAAPDMSLEEARSYVFFFNEGRESISSYIGLHFLHSDRKLFYTYWNNPFPYAQLAEVEVESRNFAEDLGAMLDEIDFAKMSDPEKNLWIDEQEIFSGRKKAADPPEIRGTGPTAYEKSETGLKSGQGEEIVSAAQPVPVPPAVAGSAAVQSAAAKPSPLSVPEWEQKRSLPETQQQPTENGAQQPASPVAPAGQQDQVLQAQVKAKTRPQRRPAEPQTSPGGQSGAPAARPEGTDEVLAQAVRDGIVKAPRQQLRKDIRGATVVSRDKEALARLLSSF